MNGDYPKQIPKTVIYAYTQRHNSKYQWIVDQLARAGILRQVHPCEHRTFDGHWKNWHGYGDWCDGPEDIQQAIADLK